VWHYGSCLAQHLVSPCSKRPCYIRRLPTISALPSGPNSTCSASRPQHSAASLLVDSIPADSSCCFVAVSATFQGHPAAAAGAVHQCQHHHLQSPKPPTTLQLHRHAGTTAPYSSRLLVYGAGASGVCRSHLCDVSLSLALSHSSFSHTVVSTVKDCAVLYRRSTCIVLAHQKWLASTLELHSCRYAM
jgi:hypothetical protein